MTGETYFGSAVKAGDYPSKYLGAGSMVMTQQVTIQADGAATVDASVVLPKGAEIIDLNFDTTVAHTAATLTIAAGVTAGGTEYASATDSKAGGRHTPTFTAAQLAAMNNVGANTTMYFRAAAGTPTTTGTTVVKVTYRMRAEGES